MYFTTIRNEVNFNKIVEYTFWEGYAPQKTVSRGILQRNY